MTKDLDKEPEVKTNSSLLKENVAVKREINRFTNRFFYHKEESIENVARMYYYLDDLSNYVNEMLEHMGNKLLEHKDFDKVFLPDEDVKVFIDEELKTILVDKISGKERDDLNREGAQKYLKEHEKDYAVPKGKK